jgi:predicted Zn-dependent protease
MLTMKKRAQSLVALLMAAAVFAVPLTALGQTKIKYRKNKYSVQQDVELGQQAAREAEKQLPILNDTQSTAYLQDVGRRLVDSIPYEFQQAEFRYYFKVVNARDINAFALPGGPMYVNRGMIEMAQSEGELAGVMAHELAHVALRHGTAQVTKQQSAKTTLITLGSIIGGAIVAGEAGAQRGGLCHQVQPRI